MYKRQVERGARRKVLNIVVEAAAEQDYEDFGKKNVASMDAEAVIVRFGLINWKNGIVDLRK